MPRIVFQNGQHQGMSIEVDKILSLGRDLSCDIHLVSPDVSRVHCKIYPYEDNYYIEDAKSRNGSFVNGNQIQKYALNHGDMICLGDLVLRFELSAEELTPVESAVFVDNNKFDENQLEMSIAMEGMNYLDLNTGGGDPKKKLATFFKIAAAVAEQPDESLLFKVILSCLFDIFPPADRGFIMTGSTADTLKEEAVFFRDQNRDNNKQLKISKTVVQMAMKKEAVLCKDAAADDGFAASQSIIEENIHGFMCVPLIAMDKIYGLIQIESSNDDASFQKDDLDLLIGVSSLAALFLRSSYLVRSAALEANKRAQLARFFSPKVAENVMNNKLELGGEFKHGSVLFCDIVGFTSISEKISAAVLVERLNEYFEVMVKIILKEEGTIDKFGGDAILSVWGAPEAIVNDSLFAIRAALNMQNAIVGFNHILISRGATPLAMGIGIHSGKFIAGNIGSKDRMEYTIIGDDVNTAKRVESTATGHMLMVSETTIAHHLDLFVGTTFNPVPLKGKSLPLSLTNIRGMKNNDNYLLSLPCEFDGQFGKIFQSNLEGNKIRFVTGGTVAIGQVVGVKFILPEIPDLESFKLTVTNKLEGPLEWEGEVTGAVIAKLTKSGITKVAKDIFWSRSSTH
jgi:adenylate cyclase